MAAPAAAFSTCESQSCECEMRGRTHLLVEALGAAALEDDADGEEDKCDDDEADEDADVRTLPQVEAGLLEERPYV